MSTAFNNKEHRFGRELAPGPNAVHVITRRLLLTGVAAFGARPVLPASKEPLKYRFSTLNAEVELSVDFHDLYASDGFSFQRQPSGRGFCLSAAGEEDRNCLANFRGSLAIAQYRVRPRSRNHRVEAIREQVRTIDYDTRLDLRPPFERTIQLRQGVASDIQAFGYEETPQVAAGSDRIESHGPWYLFRQDLYLQNDQSPFLLLYWKHALNAIRVLDVIPGGQTWLLNK